MRKVVADELMSLDGVVESRDRLVLHWDDVMTENPLRVIETQDDVVLGRSRHDEWAAYWPTARADLEFAAFISAVHKHVATSSPLSIFEHGDRVRRLELADDVTSPSGALLVGYRVLPD